MKNLSIFTILASLLFCSCSQKIVEQNSTVTLPDLIVAIEEGITRTYVEGTILYWNAADEISVFYGSTVNNLYTFKGNTGDRWGTFSPVSSSESSSEFSFAVRAVYPYQENATIADNGTISLELPSMQQYSANSFGKGANTMIGVSEDKEINTISFKNACGYLKLKLYGNVNDGNITVKSITVKGNMGEKIAGAATATMKYGGVPSLTMSEFATKSVTIDCGDGVALGTTSDAATEFWFVLPVIEFSKGISVIVTTTDDNIYEKSTSNPVSITRNEIQPMADWELNDEILMPADNEIRYTSIDKNIVEPSLNTLGPIISNEYVNAQGVIKFGDDITSIPAKAFENCTTLLSMFIPSTVETIGNGVFSGCTALTAVYCLATIPPTIPTTTDPQIFDTDISDLIIYVPFESIDDYKEDWSAYAQNIYSF